MVRTEFYAQLMRERYGPLYDKASGRSSVSQVETWEVEARRLHENHLSSPEIALRLGRRQVEVDRLLGTTPVPPARGEWSNVQQIAQRPEDSGRRPVSRAYGLADSDSARLRADRARAAAGEVQRRRAAERKAAKGDAT